MGLFNVLFHILIPQDNLHGRNEFNRCHAMRASLKVVDDAFMCLSC